MEFAHKVLEELDGETCLSLMGSRPVGRLAMCNHAGYPLVFPVNYAIESGVIVFRTAHGTKHDLSAHSLVTFEVDDFDVNERAGWSVMAHPRVVHRYEGETLSNPSVDDVQVGDLLWCKAEKWSLLTVELTAVSRWGSN